jgi:IS5 family transposase
MAITRAVVHQADVLGRCVSGRRPRIVTQLGGTLQETASVVHRVLAQARARVFKGDTHHPDKVLSIFEPHTEVIRKGKAAKPTEFGNVVKLQEADGHIITDYQVCAPRVRDECLWGPALERHRALFGRPPRLAVADAGFASTANERLAAGLGVPRVALPRRGRPPSTAPPRPRW